MKPIITTLCAVLLAIATQVAGQNMSTSFSAVPLPGQPPYPVGSHVVIDFNVTNFIDISSVSLPITYNSAVLRFDSINNVAIPEYTDLTPTFHPTAGVIKVIWFPSLVNYPDGVTLAGGAATRLMQLHFTVVGNGTSSVNLSTSVPFTPIEVINASGGQVFSNSIFNSGGSSGNGVTLTGGSGNPPPPPLVGFKIVGTNVYAKQGARVCVPVSVNDFDNMQILQYAMHWDNTKLTYECVRGTAAPIQPIFNAPVSQPGTLLMLWEDPNLLSGMGVTRADGTRIYEVCFNVIGAPGSESNITFDGLGFPDNPMADAAEAINAAGNSVWTTGGPNGPSGVSSKVFIMSEPPASTAVTFTADQDIVAPAGQTCVDVKVKNFSTITESEFMMTYDATKLTLATPITIPATSLNLTVSNFVPAVTNGTGTVKFKWSNTAGVTIADNTVIFSLCFTATGAAGSVVPINFSTSSCPNPTAFAAMKKDAGGTPYKHEAGSVTIMAQNGPPTATAVQTLCNIGATGNVTCTPNGTATSYAWSNNANTQNLTNVPVGTYTVTVTYQGGATNTASATVTAPPAITMTQAVTAVKCFGGSDGAVDVTPAGGTAPYTYAWAGPQMFAATTQDITGVISGNYNLTVTDANGCVFVTSPPIQVGSSQPISIPGNNIVITGINCFGGNNGGVGVTPIGGTAPYTYDWSNDGPEDPDNDPATITGLSAGTYTVTVTDNKGCSFVYPGGFTVSAPPQMVTNFVKKTDVKCMGSNSGTAEITVNGGTGNKTYSWRTVPGNQQVSTAQNPTDLPAGTYNVIVTDGAGCTSTLPNNIIINNPPSNLAFTHTTTPGLCFGQSTGSIDLIVTGNGWGITTYDWPGTLPDVQDQPAVSSGTYTVTVTDMGGCSATHTVVVAGAQSAILMGSPVVTDVTCFGLGNGGICINPSGGNGGPFTVSWTNTSLSGACIGALQVGSYAPTVTDAQGCSAVFTAVSVSGPAAEITMDTTVTSANPMGSIDLMVTGGTPNYTFLWSNNATSEDLTGMPAGTYTVTITDANGCSKIGVYSIPSANVLLGPSFTVQNSCSNDGCINITLPATATSAAPFTFSWNGGTMQSSNLNTSICNLAANIYTVTVTAANGNTVTVTAEVEQNQQALLNTINSQDPFATLANGSITIAPTFPNTTVLWSNGSTGFNLTNLDQGNYSVTVTNNTSQCTAVYTVTLERLYFPLTATVSQEVDPTCGSANNGSISVNIAGGDSEYTFFWTGPNGFTNTSEDISNLAPGTYNLTVTDGRDTTAKLGPIVLTAASNLDVSNVLELSTTPGGTQVSGADVCDGEASVVFSGATGNVSIVWSNGVTGANNLTLCGGAYSVTVTDAQGCSDTFSGELTAPAAIALNSNASSPKCFGQTNGTAKVFVAGGIEPYEVRWSNGQFDQLVFASTFSEAVNLAGGLYTVTITDGNGVTKTTTVTVPTPQEIEVVFNSIDPSHFNECDGERIADVSGAAEPLVYTWGTTKSGQSGDTDRAEGLCAGDVLTYIILDANGCSVTVVDTIPYPEDGCFRVRPVLTPAEQDGNNDFTNITCIEAVQDNIEIYNRWGQLVFQTEEYTNDPSDPTRTFTGLTRSGQALPEGIYYYVLSIVDEDGNAHQFKGHINLLK